MDFNKSNIVLTEHSLFRYGGRIKNELFINLNSYKALLKTDSSKVAGWEIEIIDKLNKSTFLTQGAFDKDNLLSHFYLNKEEKIIFVLTPSRDKLITLYKVDYGFGDDVNNITMSALLKEVDKLKTNKTKYQNKYSKDLEQKEFAIKSFELDIHMLQEKIKLLDSQKAILEAEIDLYNDTVTNMSKEIECKAHAICHSIGYKKQDEFN